MNEWIGGGGGGKDVSFSDKLVKKEEKLYSYISSINSSIEIYITCMIKLSFLRYIASVLAYSRSYANIKIDNFQHINNSLFIS